MRQAALAEEFDFPEKPEAKRKMRIAIIADFFFPSFGGVETHMFVLAQNLLLRGHKVILITHAYGENKHRQGVRVMSNGLKVYYCAWQGFVDKVSYFAFFAYFPLVRNILFREAIEVAHFHTVLHVPANFKRPFEKDHLRDFSGAHGTRQNPRNQNRLHGSLAL